MKTRNSEAMVPAPAVTMGAPAVTGAVMCAISLVTSAKPMLIEMPKLPNISLPKLPDINIDLPNFGKKKDAAAAAPKKTPVSRQTVGRVKVRAAKGVVPTGSVEAPTLAEVTGETAPETIKVGEGYKKFPERRMPGANMDGWKKIAKDITPNV